MRINPPVRLVLSEQVAVPMTWGMRPSIILLPCEALGWSLARRRVVLLHELAHVARHDYLTQWLTLLTCALNWFNPLVWLAARQNAIEREQASDDAVLNAGIGNTDYATHLLAIARIACQHRRLQGAIGLAFAQKSALTGRVHHILRPLPSRRGLPSRHRLALLAVIGVLILPLATVQFGRAIAQQQPVVLTIALPTYLKDTFNDQVLKDFEAANPGIQVSVTDTQQVLEAAFGLQQQLDDLQKYASSADVLFINDQGEPQITPQATRAGYFLDLSPLVNADSAFNATDFVPAIWRSYQWDNGIWAIPTDANAQLILYDPAAFDKAKVPYPSDSWTAAEFLDAVTKLTVKDAQGNIVTPGFATSGGFSREIMMRALTNGDLFDTNTVPNPPALEQPGVEAAVEAFSQMQSQGLIGGNPDKSPMSISPAAFFSQGAATSGRRAALLPGGRLYLDTHAYAISAGTQHPDAAYALIKFILQRDVFANEGEIPARTSSSGSQISRLFPPDVQTLLTHGLTSALTTADMRFADYLRIADNNIGGTGSNTTARDAIQNEQTQAIKDANAALAKKGTLALTVNEPVPVVLAAGKITLNFDVSASINPLPTQDQWNNFIQDFAAKDPLVGHVNLIVSPHNAAQAAARSDCFYESENSVPTLNESAVLSLDPYLNADATFDKTDLLGGVLTGVQRDNKTWAFPLTLQPMIMVYDSDKFNHAGLPSPSNGWTIESFVDALQHLKVTNPTDPNTTPPFVGSGDGTQLLVLIADYGGLPIDYRTSPATINFTDPATVTAIQQVLDLAKNGEIAYGALGDLFNRNTPNWNQTTAMFNIDLNQLNFISGNPKGRSLMFSNSQMALFPTGHTYTGIAYDLGAAYISATAQNPDACYRFIRALADHPELFWNMPVRHSVLVGSSAPAYKSLTGIDLQAIYNRIAAQLADPHTVTFPESTDSGDDPFSLLFPEHWLFEAFDAYVLHNADLASALHTADQQAKGYLGCIANLPALNLSDISKTNVSAARPYATCAETMEPALRAELEPFFSAGAS
jgi:ABC-type glycerol-3-phosphate transport system substrate-binding protein